MNIIYVNFKSKLELIKNTLSNDDYLDFLEGLVDYNVYQLLDEDLQTIIDNF